MPTVVSISTLKARLSAYIEIAKRGEEVIVTDRGRPVVRLSAVIGCDRLDARTRELIQTGAIRPPSKKLPADFWTDLARKILKDVPLRSS